MPRPRTAWTASRTTPTDRPEHGLPPDPTRSHPITAVSAVPPHAAGRRRPGCPLLPHSVPCCPLRASCGSSPAHDHPLPAATSPQHSTPSTTRFTATFLPPTGHLCVIAGQSLRLRRPHACPQPVDKPVHSDTPCRPHPVPRRVHRQVAVDVDGIGGRLLACCPRSPRRPGIARKGKASSSGSTGGSVTACLRRPLSGPSAAPQRPLSGPGRRPAASRPWRAGPRAGPRSPS